MINDILSVLWIFAPAGIANMAPVIANNLAYFSKFNTPIDLNKTFHGRRLLGDNKTYRGLIAGAVMAMIVVTVQMVISRNFTWPESISQGIDYSSWGIVFFGIALGLGAGVGDSVESFFKRQRGIKPGENWFPFDQIDFVTGAALFSYPFVDLSLGIYLTLYIVALILHPLINIIGYLIGLQDNVF